MDQLKGKLINIVLVIQEGKGMESMKHLTFVSANFNGRVLESDAVAAEDCPLYNSNLIWEIEKKELRKIRSSNKPLRVDCFSIDSQNRQEKFGYVLLDLRSAHIIADSKQEIIFKWQKLVGVRNKKRNCIPELYISLTLRNRNEIDNDEVHIDNEIDLWQAEPRRESSIPVTYMENGHIMIGEQNIHQDEYLMNIIIKSATNLDLLLPEVLVFNQNNNKYYMCIKIFGIPIKTKIFSKDLHNEISFEEKIVVKILSNADTLRNFFKEEIFEVEFNCGNDVLGKTILNFEGFVNLDEKLYLPSCFFSFPSPNGVMPFGNNGRKPSISLELFLLKEDNLLKSDTVTLLSSKASGDYEKNPNLSNYRNEEIDDLVNWQEKRKIEFEDELKNLKEKFLEEEENAIRLKKIELDESIQKCSELQKDLYEQLDNINLCKTLQKKKNSSNDLSSAIEDNKIKFASVDNNLLIEYITNLQKENEHLKQLIVDQKREFEDAQKAALTKEQTLHLLQELKVLEEKFEFTQQNKRYFKEQWKEACQEIHVLKTQDYKQIKNQICEQREELDQIQELYNTPQLNTFLMQ